MTDKITEIHTTCTSSQLSGISNLDSEHVSFDVLAIVHKGKTGTELSSDPAVSRIQREQAVVWAKRNKDAVKKLLEEKAS